MTKITDVSKLDFDSIKSNLKEFMSAQDQFTDVDFEGSGISALLDVLAYNTHMNAMIAHMNLNETFLDTARARSSVVSHSQTLGYIPRSAVASRATVSLRIVGTDTSASSITIERGATFNGKINSKSYSFTVLSPVSASKQTDYIYDRDEEIYFYEMPAVEVFQGEIRNIKIRADKVIKRQAIEIPSPKIDTSTLQVRIYDTANSSTYTDFTYYDKIEDVTTTTPVYFLRENPFGNYEIYFGDDFIGKNLKTNNLVEVEFLDTSGAEANDIRQLTIDGPITNLSKVTTTMVSTLAYGGKDKEEIESVRSQAPVSYATQNRAVTAADYKSLILQKFTQVKDVSVWGGEDASPPQYGKVFIAPALFSKQPVTSTLNKEIKDWIKYRNVGSVKVDMISAEYTYIELEVEFKFNPRKSKYTVKQAEKIIKEVVAKYDSEELGQFDGILRNSNLLTAIDQADPGITSSIIRTKCYKIFNPDPLRVTEYTIEFPVQIYQSASTESVISTTPFYLNARLVQIKDEPSSEKDLRNLYVFDVLAQKKDTFFGDIGTANLPAGVVTIKNILPDNAQPIELVIRPETYDITPKRNQLVVILSGDVTVLGSEDTVDKYSVKGLTDYNASSRH